MIPSDFVNQDWGLKKRERGKSFILDVKAKQQTVGP
jgi:hypothetical protein